MTKKEILEQLFASKDISKIINQRTKDQYYQQELKSELFKILQEKSEEDIVKIYEEGKIIGYCSGIIKNQFDSNTSEFYKVQKKSRQTTIEPEAGHEEIPDNDDNSEELESIAQKEFNKLGWYDKQIFQYYVDGMSILKISALTNINRKYISDVIHRVREQLKHNIRKNL